MDQYLVFTISYERRSEKLLSSSWKYSTDLFRPEVVIELEQPAHIAPISQTSLDTAEDAASQAISAEERSDREQDGKCWKATYISFRPVLCSCHVLC